jgi:hypothetical protein
MVFPQNRSTSFLTAAGTTLDGATYTYDNAGNRKTRTPKPTGAALTYTYDNIYQLQMAKQGATTKESYTDDVVGNRLLARATHISPSVFSGNPVANE